MDLDPPSTIGEVLTGGHITFEALRVTPFTPSKKHTMAHLDTIIFYKTTNTIMRRSKKRLKVGTQDDMAIITENIIMEGTHKEPKFTASVNIVVSEANTDNVDILMNGVEQNKEKMFKLKDNLVKVQGEVM